MRRQRGLTLIEVVVVVAIVGIIAVIIVMLERETLVRMRTTKINYFRSPDQVAFLSRFRRDVLDAVDYGGTIDTYSQTEQTLILIVSDYATKKRTAVVYDFTKPGDAWRYEYDIDTQKKTSEWVAHGVPQYKIEPYEADATKSGIHLRAASDDGSPAVDMIVVPRV